MAEDIERSAVAPSRGTDMPLAASTALPPEAQRYVERKIPHVAWSLTAVAIEGEQLVTHGWMKWRANGADAAPTMTVTFDSADGMVSTSPIEGRSFASFCARCQIDPGRSHVAIVPGAPGDRRDEAVRRRPLFVLAEPEASIAEVDWPYTDFRRLLAVLLEENRHRLDLVDRSLLFVAPSRIGDFFSDFGARITNADAIERAAHDAFHLVVAELPPDLAPQAVPLWLEALARATAKDGLAILAYPGDAVAYGSAATRHAIDALDSNGVLDRWIGGDDFLDPTPRTLMTDAWAHAQFSRDFLVSRIAFAATTRHWSMAVLRSR